VTCSSRTAELFVDPSVAARTSPSVDANDLSFPSVRSLPSAPPCFNLGTELLARSCIEPHKNGLIRDQPDDKLFTSLL
jgi:hypothetical protein